MSTTPFQSLHRTCVLIQTPYTLFENTNTKSWFKNNLGRLLCKELQIRIGSSPVYDNKLENLIMVYKDLWLPDERREDMSEYGIATENLRKLMSRDDSASTSDKADNALFKAHGKRIKIKLGKILNQGLFAPSALNGGVEFNFKTPSAREIMIAQSGESVGDYALKESKLIYKSIESSDAYSQAAAEYADTDFSFVDISYLKPTNWGKDQTSVVESVNVPRRSMRWLSCSSNTLTRWIVRSTYIQISQKWMLPSMMEDQTQCIAME